MDNVTNSSQPQQTQQPGPTPIEAWERLCAAFSADPELWLEVHQAISDPASYFARHQQTLAEWDCYSPDQISPWLALTQWLAAKDHLVELNSRDSSDELWAAFQDMPQVAHSSADLTPVYQEQVHLIHGVIRANRILAPTGLSILRLDTGADTFSLTIIPSASVPGVIELAASLGYNARQFSNADASAAIQAGWRGYSNQSLKGPWYPAAGTIGKRIGALAIDAFALVAIMNLAVFGGIAINGANNNESGVIFGVLIAVSLLYMFALAAVCGQTGATLGMLVFGLRIVQHDTLGKAGFGRCLGRGAMIFLVIFWIWALVLLITTASDKSGRIRGIQDRASGTSVLDIRRGLNPFTTN